MVRIMKYLPATEVKNRFGRVLREIATSGDIFVVERSGKPVAVIMGIEEYEQSQKRPFPSQKSAALLQEAFGMWANRADIDDTWLNESREQWESRWQDA